jgi:DNA-directed RNA polymerase beta subunit/DNA-directed RNA polymerase beta' subunit
MLEASEIINNMKQGIKESIDSLGKIEAGGKTLEFQNVHFEDHDPRISVDFEKHKQAKLHNKTLGIGVYADAHVTENGNTSVEKVKIGNMPVPTSTGDFIVDGNSYNIDYQFRLKPGAYLRKKQNGEIETHINPIGFPNARVTIDPKTLGLSVGIGQANINALAFLHALDVTTAEQEHILGSDIYKANLNKLNLDKELSKLEQSISKGEKLDKGQLSKLLKEKLDTAKLDPRVTGITLGKPFKDLGAGTIKAIIQKTIAGSKGLVEPDERDAMAFKNVFAVDDFVKERLSGRNKYQLAWQVKSALVKDKPIKESLSSKFLDSMIHPLFTSSAISEFSSRTNQLQQLGAFRKVTSTGEGGIMNEQAITTDMQAVHPTQAYFVDPLNTPESQKAGIAVQFTHDVEIKDHEAHAPFINTKTGKRELKSSIDLFNEHVLLPGAASPDGTIAAIHKGKQIQVKPEQITYKPIHIHQAFSEGALIAPALNYNQGSRASMRTRHAAQAVSLVDREAPLVQSLHPSGSTYEQEVAKKMALIAPEDLTFVEKKNDRLFFKTKDNKLVDSAFWNHDVGTNKSFINHETDHLTPGMKFTQGQIIADSNFTKNGTLALGKNLKTAYMPWHGLNFEDGIIVSESGAKKLTSQHMAQHDFDVHNGVTRMSKAAYLAMFPGKYTKEQLDKLDENGVAKQGIVLQPGDPMHLKIDKHQGTKEDAILGRLHKSLVSPYRDHSEVWTHVTPGTVVDSVLDKTFGKINVKYEAPAQVGDKLANRHGAKGVISAIIPDIEMPQNKKNEVTDVIISPMSVISRMSMGQILETAASKIAKKTGETYKIGSFDNKDHVSRIQHDLAKHKLSDTEELFDKQTGHSYGKILTGYPIMQKLFKLSHGNLSARELGAYDSDHQPMRGGDTGSKAIDQLTLYGLLAHGHRNILNEISTVKGDYNPDFWQRLQMGLPLPKPQTPFVYKKFEGLLAASGVNVRQDGSQKILAPFTDKDTDAIAGENHIQNFKMLNYDMEPVKGGLFDTQITGGMKGTKWAKFTLPNAIPNPLFETAIKNILTIDDKTFKGLLNHTVNVNGKTGHEAFESMLGNIQVKQEIDSTKQALKTATKTGKDKYLKKLKLLKALESQKLHPKDAYMMSKVPVVPPQFRPVIQLPNGSLSKSSLNILYRDAGLVAGSIKEHGLDGDLYSALYHSVGAIQGVKDPISPQAQKQNVKGAIQIITGSTPKTGFFQSKVIRKQQDLSARATIALDNNLHMDQISIPIDMAKSIYKPFATKLLIDQGYSAKDAHDHIDKWSHIGKIAIMNEMNQRPIMMNRAPSLHRFSIMSFKPTVNTTDSTVLIPGLIVKPFGADFDGDTVMLHVPVGEKARKEALKMLPSNNLYNAKAMDLNYTPDQESIMGLHLMSHTANGRKYFNSLLPASVSKVTGIMKKEDIHQRLAEVAAKHPHEYNTIATKLKEEGDKFATLAGFSIGLKDMKPVNGENVKKIYSKAMLKPGDKLKNLLEADDFIKNHSTDDKTNNYVKMVTSQSKGNKENLKQILFAPGIMKDHNDQPILRPVMSNYGSGVDFADFWTAGYGARKGTLDRQMSTARPGALNKEIVNTSMAIVVSENDCGTTNGISISAKDPHVLGRYDAESGKLITKDLLKNKKDIIVRSPITCEATRGVCKKCYGHDEFGSMPDIGRNVGIVSAQAMSEPLTQAAMKTFHMGGTVSGGGGAFGGFETIERFLKAPKTFKNKAVLAREDGIIHSINPGAAGGFNIMINEQEHFIHPDASGELLVRKGQKVNRGDLLNVGIPHPEEALDILGPIKGSHLVVDTLHKLYKASDIKINRRNLETVIRGLTGFAKVTDPGTSKTYVENDVTSLSNVMKFNKEANKSMSLPIQESHGMILSESIAGIKAGTSLDFNHLKHLEKAGHKHIDVYHQPIQFDRIYIGTDKAPNKSTDWLGGLSFRYLKRGIETGAMHSHMSDTHGYHPMAPFVTGELQHHSDGTY